MSHDSKIIPAERSIAGDLPCYVLSLAHLASRLSPHSSRLFLTLLLLRTSAYDFIGYIPADAVCIHAHRSPKVFTTTETTTTAAATHIYYSLKQTSSAHLVWRQSAGFFFHIFFFCLVFVRRFQWRQANRIFVYIYKMHDFRHRYSFRVESLNWKHHTTPGVNYNYREFTYSTYQRTYLKIFYSNNLRRPYLHHNIACSSVKENNKIQLKIRFFFKVHSSE